MVKITEGKITIHYDEDSLHVVADIHDGEEYKKLTYTANPIEPTDQDFIDGIIKYLEVNAKIDKAIEMIVEKLNGA